MTEGQVVTGESMFFRAEDEGDPGSVGAFAFQKRNEIWKRNNGLLGLAGIESAGAEHEGCGAESFGEGCADACVLE